MRPYPSRREDTLSVRLNHADKLVKVTWIHEGHEKFYFVSRSSLEESAHEIRALLSSLVDEWTSNGESDATNKSLLKLAEAGSTLYFKLFDAESMAGTESNATEVKDKLEDVCNGEDSLPPIKFVDDNADLDIPWGLVFTPEPEGTDFLSSYYENFWCVKHWTATLRVRGIEFRSNQFRTGDEPILLGVFHREAQQYADPEGLRGWPTDRMCFDTETFSEVFQEFRDSQLLVYFFCHAKGTELCLCADPEDILNARKFYEKALKRDRNKKGILFLNGCSTAMRHRDTLWLRNSTVQGFRGFVGTEAKVPIYFAWRFGTALLKELLASGMPIVDVLNGLREKHRPLSLLYSLYCHPTLRFEGATNTSYLLVPEGNYSELNLRTELFP